MRKPGAGDFRNRIVIEKDAVTTAASGERTHVWTEFLTLWSKIVTGTAREIIQAQQVVPEVNVVIRLRRYHQGIMPEMRVRYDDPKGFWTGLLLALRWTTGSRYFQILGVINPEEWRDELWLACREMT